MRATRLSAVLAFLSVSAATGANALPPPPYQTADQGGPQGTTPYTAPQALDRYGGFQHYRAPTNQPTAPSASPHAASGHYIGWAGKTEAQAPAAQSPGSGGWTTMPTRWDQPPTRAAQARDMQASAIPSAWSPPHNEWRPEEWRPVPGQDSSAPRPAPTSIYDPPSQAAESTAAMPPAPQYRMAQAQAPVNPQGGPRFYSLHREYGIQPDAIPLPPQFFGPTADLSAPVTDPLARRTTVVNGQTHTVAVPDDQGSQ